MTSRKRDSWALARLVFSERGGVSPLALRSDGERAYAKEPGGLRRPAPKDIGTSGRSKPASRQMHARQEDETKWYEISLAMERRPNLRRQKQRIEDPRCEHDTL